MKYEISSDGNTLTLLGTLNIDDNFIIPEGKTINIGKREGKYWQFPGIWVGAGDLINNGTINIISEGGLGISSSLVNNNTINSYGGLSVRVTGYSSIRNSGTMDIYDYFGNNGEIINTEDGVINILPGTNTTNTSYSGVENLYGGIINNEGKLNIKVGSAGHDGKINNNGTINNNGEINNEGTIQNNEGIIKNNGTITGNSIIEENIVVEGDRNTNPVNIPGSTFIGDGTVTIAADMLVTASAPVIIPVGQILENNGILHIVNTVMKNFGTINNNGIIKITGNDEHKNYGKINNLENGEIIFDNVYIENTASAKRREILPGAIYNKGVIKLNKTRIFDSGHIEDIWGYENAKWYISDTSFIDGRFNTQSIYVYKSDADDILGSDYDY